MKETIGRSFGKRLRRIRQGKGLTLKQIEAKVGVSATHISEIERGNTSPTIRALERIALALDVAPSYLIDIPPLPNLRILSPEARTPLTMDRGTITLDPLTDRLANSEMSFFVATIGADGHVVSDIGDQGEEFCYVLEGLIEVIIDGDSRVLRRGDAVHFKANRSHQIRNLASIPSRALWATRPRLFI